MISMLHRALLAGVGLAAVSVAPALGADLPRAYTKAPVMVAPVFSWTGFYIGLHAGYGFDGDSEALTTGLAAANQNAINNGSRPGVVRLDRDGFIGGGQIGYNWQAGAWVFGVEADLSYTDFRDNVTVVTNNAAGANFNNTFRSELEYLGTVRGRLGYTWARTMGYVTGGLAYGELNQSVNMFNANGALGFSGARSDTETGYVIGGGFEHAFAPNWSAKFEYLYYDLGDTNVTVAAVAGNPAAAGPGFNTRFENNGHIVRAGINYKFGWQ